MRAPVSLPVLALMLAACARTPTLPGAEQCASPAPLTAMLRVIQAGESVQSLLVQGSPEPAGYTWVAMNTVGVPGFTAVQEGTTLRVEERPTYRGPDPEWMVWGLYWWQQRASLTDCPAPSGFHHRERPGSREIRRGRALAWLWTSNAPLRFKLPIPELEVWVRQRDEGDE